MIVNVRLDLTDGQLQGLAGLLAGRPVKRKATRAEVADLVGQALAALAEAPAGDRAQPPASPGAKAGMTETPDRAPLSPAELREAERLASAGKPPGYIRGWILAGRLLRK